MSRALRRGLKRHTILALVQWATYEFSSVEHLASWPRIISFHHLIRSVENDVALWLLVLLSGFVTNVGCFNAKYQDVLLHHTTFRIALSFHTIVTI